MQIGIHIKGFDHFAIASELNVTEGTNIGGTACGNQCIEGGIEGRDFVGSGLKYFPHNVHGNTSTIGQGDFHLVGTHVKIVAEGGFDECFGTVKWHAFHINASQLTQLNSSAAIHFGYGVVIAHPKDGYAQFVPHTQFIIGGCFGINTALINF